MRVVLIGCITRTMFIFSFCLDAKRKNEPKKKNTLITAMPSA